MSTTVNYGKTIDLPTIRPKTFNMLKIPVQYAWMQRSYYFVKIQKRNDRTHASAMDLFGI